MKFCVPIIYTGLANYIVETEDITTAKIVAKERFHDGEVGELLGNEWEQIERIGEIEKVPDEKG